MFRRQRVEQRARFITRQNRYLSFLTLLQSTLNVYEMYLICYIIYKNRGSSVGITTAYGLDKPQ